MAFQVSPGVTVSEVDLTTVVPAVSTTAGAFVGDFQWGPANKRTLITHETELARVFGKPSANASLLSMAEGFFSAANFLAYGNNLQVVRAVANTDWSAQAGTGAAANVATQIDNIDAYDAWTANSSVAPFVARYPGELGNSLKVSIATASANYSNWEYKANFTVAPSNTASVSVNGAENDQFHLIVIDEDGKITGVANTILEKHEFLSFAPDAQFDDGSTAYFPTVLRNNSQYIYGNAANTGLSGNVGITSTSGIDYADGDLLDANGVYTASFANGVSTIATETSLTAGLDLFANKDEVDISLIVTGSANANVVTYAIDNIAEVRKDCVVFVSPEKATVVGNTAPLAASGVSDWADNYSSSYAVADSGWKYQFDKYNNRYIWVPLNGDVAGICVRTDETNDPWFSPAGYSRGQVKNVVKLAWNPNQGQRDTIYAKSVNPVITVPGQGTILFGDKTLTRQPSAFNRINVRRLFIVLEKAIANAAKYSLFEMNDEFTRAQFVAIVEPFLRDVKGRRGIYDYRVVCDTTNNTSAVIDANRFVGDIYVKPARSVNYIQLNFVAVRTGVEFAEIVGGI